MAWVDEERHKRCFGLKISDLSCSALGESLEQLEFWLKNKVLELSVCFLYYEGMRVNDIKIE